MDDSSMGVVPKTSDGSSHIRIFCATSCGCRPDVDDDEDDDEDEDDASDAKPRERGQRGNRPLSLSPCPVGVSADPPRRRRISSCERRRRNAVPPAPASSPATEEYPARPLVLATPSIRSPTVSILPEPKSKLTKITDSWTAKRQHPVVARASRAGTRVHDAAMAVEMVFFESEKGPAG